MQATWHVHFDGQLEIALHACALHRAIGASLPCPDAGPDGDCAHVQTRRCDCQPRPACDGCTAVDIDSERARTNGRSAR